MAVLQFIVIYRGIIRLKRAKKEKLVRAYIIAVHLTTPPQEETHVLQFLKSAFVLFCFVYFNRLQKLIVHF